MPAPNSLSDFWRQVSKTAECWLWIGACPGGKRYGRFGYEGLKHAAHRFSWTINVGPIPKGLHVLHHCDNGLCVRPDHLFLGSHQDNMLDMFAKKRRRILQGSAQGQAKITESDAVFIREQYANGSLQRELAARFGIDQTTISKIIRREAWSHV